MGRIAFPEGFVWGAATSAYQIEGAPEADGKGLSIWDSFSRTPGNCRNDETGDRACEHYQRFREDVALMKDLGLAAYRFSISWPRVIPDGRGAVNERGLAFYSRLVDALLEAGITPWPTLYHWDLPQALQDHVGGWQSRETAHAFADYAAVVAGALSDRVQNFFTINEFASFVDMGYRGLEVKTGARTLTIRLAPGLALDRAGLLQVRHHAVLGQGLAVQAIRAHGRPGTRCGPADNLTTAVPAIATDAHAAAARAATRELNAGYLTVMLEGAYTDLYLERAGADAPHIADTDLAIIASPVDFVGLNLYRPAAYVLAGDAPGQWQGLPFAPSHPRMGSAWHSLGPETLYWGCRHLHDLWGPRDIFITENGCAADDTAVHDGRASDTDRIMYLRNSLLWLHRAIAEGMQVRGHFAWSLMDNYEWTDGYARRFGLVHVDFATQKRTPKASADWYREVIAANALL
ncbi:MAG: GH1 family beta-glucosidase [Sphingomonadaceae bacterium]